MSECGQKYRKTRKTKKINGIFFLLYPLPFILYSLFFPLPRGVLQAPPGASRAIFRGESQTPQSQSMHASGGACLFRLAFPDYRRFVASTITPCLRTRGRRSHPRRKIRGQRQHYRKICIHRRCQYLRTALFPVWILEYPFRLQSMKG